MEITSNPSTITGKIQRDEEPEVGELGDPLPNAKPFLVNSGFEMNGSVYMENNTYSAKYQKLVDDLDGKDVTWL